VLRVTCRPPMIALTMSGASRVSRRRDPTYDALISSRQGSLRCGGACEFRDGRSVFPSISPSPRRHASQS
jgi:hypothetical protein